VWAHHARLCKILARRADVDRPFDEEAWQVLQARRGCRHQQPRRRAALLASARRAAGDFVTDARPWFDQESDMGPKRAGKLLLVEDEHLLRGLIAQFLQAEGYEVVEAADGLQAIDLFSSDGPFGVVLLDLNLPLASGIEVCRSIRAEQPSQAVIICSAAILDSHIAALRDLRVEQFLSKPYHPLDLLQRIANELSRSSRPELLAHVPSPRTSIGRTGPRHSGLAASRTLVNSPILD
jgi:CheY-like chemotaxis protein